MGPEPAGDGVPRFDVLAFPQVVWCVGREVSWPISTSMKTYSPKPEHIERRWYVIDASDKVLGRVASEAAALLRGKHKPIFAPHMDTGDHVVVVNADKVVVTGGKEMKKFAYRHSGYPGGIKATRYDELLRTRPVYAVEKAIRGMLPKNRLGRSMIRKLHVVPGPDHPHGAQQPVAYTLGQPPMWEGLPEPVTELKTRHRTTGGAEERAVDAEPTEGTAEAPSTEGTATRSTAKKSTSKKTTAKKSTAKKPTTKKSTAKKSTATKSTAKPSAKKSTATKKTTKPAKADEAPPETPDTDEE
jgi:large subunit ribosomal protein L13